jgi:hypothetical protein
LGKAAILPPSFVFEGIEMRIIIIVKIAVLSFLFSTPAFAQGVFDMAVLTNTLTIETRPTPSVSPRSNERKPSLAPESSLSYSASAAVRKSNLSNFVKKTRAVDPEGASKMEVMFASTDVIDAIGKGIAPFGLRTNNVADAYTVYWTNAWLGSRGRNDTLSKQQVAAVRNQAANALLATPAFSSASNAQKQEMSEALLVQAALIEAYVDNAKSDPALMSKVKAAIAQGAKGMGLDLYKMTLTPDGFVPAKRGSAVDEDDLQPGSASDEQALASSEPSESRESPNYALIAAAGGAGLGGMFLLGKMMGRKS